ncbi:MAG: TorF family putative porin [Sedimenticolaceae bacterium]
MKINKVAMVVGALMISGSVAAEFSANIGATSNYVWRGVTQTDNGAAVSGGLDYAHDSGFYAGTWASNVDFGDGSGAEVDLYGGFGNKLDNGLGYDVGATYYAYPNYDDSNFSEIYGSLSYKYFTAGINYTVWSQVDDTKGVNETFIEGDTYYYLSGSYEIKPTWTLGGTVGYYDFKDDGKEGIDTSYSFAQLDVGKGAGDFGDFTFSVSKAGKESGSNDTLVFVSWAKTFE